QRQVGQVEMRYALTQGGDLRLDLVARGGVSLVLRQRVRVSVSRFQWFGCIVQPQVYFCRNIARTKQIHRQQTALEALGRSFSPARHTQLVLIAPARNTADFHLGARLDLSPVKLGQVDEERLPLVVVVHRTPEGRQTLLSIQQ